MLTHRGVEQLAARWAHNPEVISNYTKLYKNCQGDIFTSITEFVNFS